MRSRERRLRFREVFNGIDFYRSMKCVKFLTGLLNRFCIVEVGTSFVNIAEAV